MKKSLDLFCIKKARMRQNKKKYPEAIFLDQTTYRHLYEKHTKNSPLFKNCFFAFLIGGLICVAGQGLFDLYQQVCGFDAQTAGALVSVSLIFLSALLTGFGLYDDLARLGGAGTLVPVTGFANAMIAPALEFRTEGFVLGTSAKLFTIAGPVLAYGTLASVLYGVGYYLCRFVCV